MSSGLKVKQGELLLALPFSGLGQHPNFSQPQFPRL